MSQHDWQQEDEWEDGNDHEIEIGIENGIENGIEKEVENGQSGRQAVGSLWSECDRGIEFNPP